jgi:FkbM family methyltransferase
MYRPHSASCAGFFLNDSNASWAIGFGPGVAALIAMNSIELAVAYLNEANWSGAETLLEQALARDPQSAPALHALALVCQHTGRDSDAVNFYDRAVAINPEPSVYANRAVLMRRLGKLEEALADINLAILSEPQQSSFHNNRANILRDLGRTDEAIESINQALKLDPEYPEALNNRAVLLQDLGRLNESLHCLELVVKLAPRYVQAHNNLGNVYLKLGQTHRSLKTYQRALELDPANRDVFTNLVNILQLMGRSDEALHAVTIWVTNAPFDAVGHRLKGEVLKTMGQHREAIRSFEKALHHQTEDHCTFGLIAQCWLELRQFDKSLRSIESAITLAANCSDYHFYRGVVLARMGQVDSALESFQKSIALDSVEAATANAVHRPSEATSRMARVHQSMANALRDAGRLREALEYYDNASRLDQSNGISASLAAHAASRLAQWSDVDDRVAHLLRLVQKDAVVTSWPLVALIDDPAIQLRASTRVANYLLEKCAGQLPAIEPATPKHRIHIAYLSADFFDHATMRLMAQVFEEHDRSRFELTAISFGPHKGDAMQMRVAHSVDRYIDVNEISDRDIAKICRNLKVDIAVDLKGYTKDSRTGIFVHRCAPIQINWLGYPGSMGATFIDYVIVDHNLVTAADLDYYSEKIISLPDGYQPNDAKRVIAPPTQTRVDCGLPEEGVVFCCFNNTYKIQPEVFCIWMKVLHRVPGSVLWLLEGTEEVHLNLRREARVNGICDSRLIFASRLPLAEHLARHQLADLFLDTWPCNAHTTASDALWAGLPMVTRYGNSFAGRVAASLLRQVGLDELVVASGRAYEDLAVRLANQPSELARLKAHLQAQRDRSPLFDCGRFTRNLESAYSLVMQRHYDGLAPASISVIGNPDRPNYVSPHRVNSMRQRQSLDLAELLELHSPIQVMDIGAACIAEEPVYKRLLDNGRGHLHAFEGDERHVAKLHETYGAAVSVYPFFLFDGSAQVVHVAEAASGMTSLLKPKPEALGFFNGFTNFGKVLHQLPVCTKRLDDVECLSEVDFVKMDIQGAELTVLKHGLRVLKDCVALQLEVAFVTLYENQPAFGEVDVWLREQGYVPHRFLALKRWSIAPTIRDNNFRLPFNQLLEADLVFIKDPLTVKTWPETQVKKLALLSHICFQSPDLTTYLLLELERRNPRLSAIAKIYLEQIANDVKQ